MSESAPHQPIKVFTLEQANAMLPLVRAIVTDLARLSQDVVERRERLAMMRSTPRGEGSDVYRQEHEQIQTDLRNDSDRLREYIEELQTLGVQPKNGPEGIVDFPCIMDGRVVNLCWKLGEARIEHWHDLDSGFAGRQSLPAEWLHGRPLTPTDRD
ncbi:MAG: DUF2203 domain-containing protein [Pirellulales bacterium]